MGAQPGGSATPSSRARHVSALALPVILHGWAIYTAALASGYFLSRVPRYRGESAWFVLLALGGAHVALKGASGAGASPGPSAGPGQRGAVLAALAFVGLSFLLYWPSLTLGLLSDDFVLAARADIGEFWARSGFFRPVPLMLWRALGEGPLALHVLNVGLHGVNACLVAALARRLFLSDRAAAAAGALFLCFPASVEAVAWASGIQDVLLATGCLAFVLAAASRTAGYRPACVGALGLVVALGTKETAVVVPFLALGVLLGKGAVRWPLVAAGTLVATAYLLFRVLVPGIDAGFAIAPSRYFVKELLSRPFSTLAVPFTEGELTAVPVLGVALTWLYVALAVGSVAWWRASGRSLGTIARMAAWVALSVAPVYSMFFVSGDLQGSRYLYLPACGWSLLVATALLEIPASRWARGGVVLAVLLLMVSAVGVRAHLRPWQEASKMRDDVLAWAVGRLHQTDCAAVGFRGLPDSTGGAYVFRNGFLEAVRAADGLGTKATLEAVDAPCVFAWPGTARPAGHGRGQRP